MAVTDVRATIRKIVSYISVEPFTLCWFLPSCLLIVAMENLNLEKACRVNLGQSDEICRNMIDKSINGIDCAEIDLAAEIDANLINDTIYNLTRDVCIAETESQKLLSVVFGLRAPISAIFPLIIVLFAGGWSDKKGIRKPLVLLPILGELIGSIVLLLSSIFMYEIPMEVPAFAERVIPSIFGGQTLMLMGVYSYLSQMTTEENRTFRFGCFTVFLTLVPLLSIPPSGVLFNVLGYTKIFTICAIIYIIGILYIIFILEEVKAIAPNTINNEQQVNGHENPTFVNDNNNVDAPVDTIKTKADAEDTTTAELTKKGFLREFFDPTLALALIDVIFKRRDGNLRNLIWLVIICNIAFLASLGESDLTYLYTRLKINWDGIKFTLHLTYGTLMALLGTMLMVGVFSKFIGISDAMIGIISTICTLIAKPIYAFATSTEMFYAATTIDLFVSTKAIVIKSIISKVIGTDELGRMFSILGVIEASVAFVFPTLYSFVYLNTVDTFIGAIYFLSEFFFTLTLIMFITIYLMMRKIPSTTEGDAEVAETFKSNPDLCETTKL
ncbi:lysosomal proton-coupled steroid conjugate and bile acid symporter SLC46A3-like [Chironomus tepperi]|uniref:lysosomal proton-coupled steroid conjugate and bile acid symporter SLC46A3-like n=1 Tax=Chironomus tepperi TaxID=113505 RepID=UPI00391F13F3